MPWKCQPHEAPLPGGVGLWRDQGDEETIFAQKSLDPSVAEELLKIEFSKTLPKRC